MQVNMIPGRGGEYGGLLRGLDPGARARRFLGAVDDGAIERHLAAMALDAVVLGGYEGGRLVAAVELVPHADSSHEFALSIAAGARRPEIRRRLVGAAVDWARGAASRELWAVCLPQDLGFIRAARDLGMVVAVDRELAQVSLELG